MSYNGNILIIFIMENKKYYPNTLDLVITFQFIIYPKALATGLVLHQPVSKAFPYTGRFF